MNQELSELIKKNLPAMAAGELSTYLEKAQKAFKELEAVNDAYSKLKVTVADLSAENNRLLSAKNEVEKKQIELNALQENLKEQQRNLTVEKLTYQLQAEKDSKGSIYSLVSLFMNNPRAIEIMAKNTTISTNSNYNNGHTDTYPVGHMEREIREKYETKDPTPQNPSQKGLNPGF